MASSSARRDSVSAGFRGPAAARRLGTSCPVRAVSWAVLGTAICVSRFGLPLDHGLEQRAGVPAAGVPDRAAAVKWASTAARGRGVERVIVSRTRPRTISVSSSGRRAGSRLCGRTGTPGRVRLQERSASRPHSSDDHHDIISVIFHQLDELVDASWPKSGPEPPRFERESVYASSMKRTPRGP